MSQNEVQALLQQGIEAARSGDRAAARELFERVVEMDQNNEKGWFWLASVVDTDEEKRICLTNVLHINPGNERARQAMDVLERQKKEAIKKEEVAPGITRGQLTLVLGGAIVFILVVVAVLLAVTSSNHAQNVARTEAAIAAAATGTEQHNLLFLYPTLTSEAATATQFAIATPTPEPTNTPNIATLPPTFTPTPEPTATPTRAVLPPPTGLRGNLAGWSGRDVQNNGFLEVGYYALEGNLLFNRVGSEVGRNVSFFPNGQRIVYTRYDELSFSTVLESVNINGTQQETLSDRWFGTGVGIIGAEQPRVGSDSLSVVFVGRPQNDPNNRHVFILSLAGTPPGQSPVRQITNDDADYSYPMLSPDGRRIVAVRNLRNANPAGIDIVVIDVATGAKVPVTNDYNTTIETQPRWSPDGSQIVYASQVANEPNNYDIVVRASDGTGSPILLIRDPANDQHPVLSPDGRYLAFSSNRNGAWDIYIFNIITGELSQLTDSQFEDYPSDWWALPS